MRGRGQVSLKIAGIWKRLLARVTDKLWAPSRCTLSICAFKWFFLEKVRLHFRHWTFCDTWPCTVVKCLWRSLSLSKSSVQRWQNSPLIFQQRSTLLTTGKTELNAQGCQLWNLTVHIDLVSKRCIISVMRFRWWNSNQQCRIKSRGARPDLLFAMDRCIYCDVNVKFYTILCQVTWPTEVSRRRLRACLFIRLKTDTFGHAVLQHSLLQVGAQAVAKLAHWSRGVKSLL